MTAENLFDPDITIYPVPDLETEKDFLIELVGEGKKFKDNQALAKGKVESDAYIERLQRELAGLREDLTTRTRLEEVVDKLSSRAEPTPSSMDEPTPSERVTVTPESIDQLLDSKLKELESARSAKQNFDFVVSKLKESFGQNFQEKIREQADQLGVGERFLNDLAKTQPRAFLKLVGVSEKATKESFTPPPRSLSPSFTPNSGERTKTYYDAIKEKDRAQYWSPAVQNQMHKDAIRLGDDFYK